MKQSHSGKKWLAALAACGGAFLALGTDHRLTLRQYALSTPRWPRGRTVRLAVVADLHGHCFGEHQRDLMGMLRDAAPDVVLLPGDIVDDRLPQRGAWIFLRQAAKLAPTFFVAGNHEFSGGEIRLVKEKIRSCGVQVLSDEVVELEVNGCPLVIAGADDPARRKWQSPAYRQELAMQRAFARLGSLEGYRVLLAHRPERIPLYLRFPFELVVSGHAHGGQVRVPGFINGLVAPDQGLFPRYAGGLYRHGGTDHLVSRGVAMKYRPRVFNPPEVVVVDVRGIG